MAWEVVGERIYDMVDRDAPEDVWDEFYSTLETLSQDGPYPEDQPGMGVLTYQEPSRPNCFTIPFDHGLLLYQVMRDFPVIKLVDAFWGD